jgi:OFA family oxalate/formate antiporter-like MFS transporter
MATLSIFVDPMTRGFGWSRTALSGAVSLGGLLAALSSVVRWIAAGAPRVVCRNAVDRNSEHAALSYQIAADALPVVLWARLNLAGPFDLGITK